MSTETRTVRTPDEILARIQQITDEDFWGHKRDVLLSALDYSHVREFLNEDVTADQWAESQIVDIATAASEYYTFALGKIEDHRGLSAERSVDKLGEYAWLLGRDDVIAAMEAAEYPQYGAPKIRAFGNGFGYAWPADLDRMAEGLPCSDDCYEGCGS